MGNMDIYAHGSYIVCDKTDGTRLAYDIYQNKNIDLTAYQNAKKICAYNNLVAITNDGKCAIIDGSVSQEIKDGVSKWKDLINIIPGNSHMVGLKSDGTCLCVGDEGYEFYGVSSWKNIKKIYEYNCIIVGLKTDGTVNLIYGHTGTEVYDTSSFSDITDISIGVRHIAGLKSNGTVVINTARDTRWSGTELEQDNQYNYHKTVATWTNIKNIYSSNECLVGLKNDNTIVIAGNIYMYGKNVVSGWTNINKITCNSDIIVGLKNDGTVNVVGYTANYDNIDLVSKWKNIVDIAVGYKTIYGLQSNGVVVHTGDQSLFTGIRLKMDFTGLLQSRKALDFSKADYVDAFTLDGILPTDCKKKLAFKVDSTYYKLTQTAGTAALTALPTQAITADSIFTEGNTVEEIAACTNNAALVGKQVYPVVAMYAPDGATAFPSVKLAGNARNKQDSYTKEEYSAEYALINSTDKAIPRIIDITANVTTKGKASVKVQVSCKNSDGTWTDYIDLLTAKDRQATAVKYKAVYTVSTIDGTDSAHVDSITIRYTAGSGIVSGSTAELLTVTQDYKAGLQFVQAVIKHKKFIDAAASAFVSFRPQPVQRELYQIGTGTGAAQTIKVADTGINHNTLIVKADNKIIDFSYNTETSEITVTAEKGAVLMASYEYGWKPETWRAMTLANTQYNNDSGLYITRWTYTLPDSETVTAQTVSNVKIVLDRPTGSVKDQMLGTGTGSKQTFLLPHKAKKETIFCSAAASYDDDSQLLTVVAAAGAEIKVSYDWIAESQEITGLTVGWAE